MLQLEDALQQLVSILGMRAYLVEELLVLEVEAPVALEVVALGLVLGQLERACLADWLGKADIRLEAKLLLIALLVLLPIVVVKDGERG